MDEKAAQETVPLSFFSEVHDRKTSSSDRVAEAIRGRGHQRLRFYRIGQQALGDSSREKPLEDGIFSNVTKINK